MAKIVYYLSVFDTHYNSENMSGVKFSPLYSVWIQNTSLNPSNATAIGVWGSREQHITGSSSLSRVPVSSCMKKADCTFLQVCYAALHP